MLRLTRKFLTFWEKPGWFYAARRCASAKFSGSDRTVCRSELAIRSNTSFMVSWILVLGL